ncbi:hypothetical protein BBO99_00009751 [Phytophthora kernoviae]|uniref:Nudix hydrolase domain-containing protein n=2 Tax=Phytophthora kernoviae TaxID=325452 RepID=A0A3R7GPY2_9STRA|nr:hypothetical protein G195_010284 [Phytophthora kernoviae 00238/432]KAG2519282.1 hypothetical protein JM18_005459 [Phytophthora kernoviae]KAG2520021.1 hypothetical protein JM16_005570 [Phytophthora kernoviae]RLN46663.1 hypothetical protein BBI17_009798 [Phytophthora kernoviae]RLN72602.1 hypothetical protein BBO99_00009751 [Phytophthora kernoviae]
MRKAVAEMENGKKLATSTVLTSLVGRGKQRYSKDGRRLLSCIVVSHPEKGVGKDVLLISSSGKEGKWILPKGGWESHETITASALREVGEEAGVAGTITSSLGKMNFQNKKDKPYRYYGFELQATKIFDDWAESTRSRKWVTYKEAKGLLKDEPQMVKMVARAELSNLLRKRIAAGNQ